MAGFKYGDEYEFEGNSSSRDEGCIEAKKKNRDDRDIRITYLNDPLVQRMSALLSSIVASFYTAGLSGSGSGSGNSNGSGSTVQYRPI